MRKSIAIILLTVMLLSAQALCNKNGNNISKQRLEKEQTEKLAKLSKKYPFLQLQHDSIIRDKTLQPFQEKIHDMKENNRIINIVHLGDSHIQADMMTQEIRVLLQKAFGNAGRGLLFPHRIARSNGPNNIRSTFSGVWQQVSIVSKKRESEPGIATRSVFTSDSAAAFTILVNDYDFNKIRILAPKSETHFDFRIGNGLGESLSSKEFADNTFQFKAPSDSFALKIIPEADKNEFRLNGIVLQNNAESGILYHSMGTNGAHFYDYNNTPDFFSQLPLLQPDLIIVSLGTNEGSEFNSAKKTEHAAREMIKNIRAIAPQAPILLTTPAPNFYRKKYPNVRLKLVRDALLKVALETKVAVIDLYAIGGGFNASKQWKDNRLLQRDGVHYTEEGYRLQGHLIYNAIIDGYLKHAN